MTSISRFVLLALALSSCKVIDTGHRGVLTRFGEVVGEPLREGLHFYNILTSSIREINVQEQKFEGSTMAFTKDTQSVNITFAITWSADEAKVNDLYRQIGAEDAWVKKAIEPMTLGAIKDAIGSYIADDLVTKREAARDKVLQELKAALATRNFDVIRIDFTNLDFDDKYEQAVEAKVVAIQKAAEAQNKTVQVREEAAQKVIAAEAEAKSMKIRADALSQNRSLVEYEAVQKWNGKLPDYMMGNSMPFINVGNMK